MKYVKFDMHCHTAEGSVDAKVNIEDYIEILRSKGFGGMLVTDHDSYGGYDAYLSYGKKYDDYYGAYYGGNTTEKKAGIKE